MTIRPRLFADRLPRARLARALAGFILALPLTFAIGLPAHAALLPEGVFDMPVQPGDGAAAVEADYLSFDARKNVISAEGDVRMLHKGVQVRADRVDYNQGTGELIATGNVIVKDRQGTVYEMDKLEITGGMKDAFIDSLTLTTEAGAVVTARDVHYRAELETILTQATYSPCGLCIDDKGRRIGWKVKAARMIYDRNNASVILEQPTLELLGVPVAWIPWFWAPDPTQPRARGLRMPRVGVSGTRGVQATVPFFVPVGEDIDIILEPTLMSRQGFLASGALTWRIPDWGGVIEVKASGLYQWDRSAFAGQVGDRDWRGAIQTAGTFTPVATWTTGWSYSAFTDNAYLTDYALSDAKSSVNEVFATHLSDDTYFDARIQRFNRLGNYTAADDEQQGLILPKIEGEHIAELPNDMGRVRINAEVLGVRRGLDQYETKGAALVPYVYGYEGSKIHGMVEGAWEKQVVLPGGIAATPYLGLRLDGTTYDRTAAPLPGPYPTQPDAVLFSATPIAALDVRWPVMARNGGDSHLFEPIAQIVYRGSDVTRVGITNDDAHSFAFDTSNLFSYNRFSGIDRQETGLRANVGGHYLGSFEDGSWIDVMAGQSFHLAGVNGLGVADEVQVGNSSGLGTTASYIVASARGGFTGGLSGGAKVQIDPSLWRITRAGTGVTYAPASWFSLGVDYAYTRATPALGIDTDDHQVTGSASVTPIDYYTVAGDLTWNLQSNAWSKAHIGLTYDDNYLVLGGKFEFTPSSWGFGVTMNLKGPDNQVAF